MKTDAKTLEQLLSDLHLAKTNKAKKAVAQKFASEHEANSWLLASACQVAPVVYLESADRIKSDPYFFACASNSLDNIQDILTPQLARDEAFLLKALRHDSSLYFKLPEHARTEKLFFSALKGDYFELCDNGRPFSPEQQTDKEFIKKAVAANGRSLAYASEELRNDLSFLLEISEDNHTLLVHAAPELVEKYLNYDQARQATKVMREALLALQAAQELQTGTPLAKDTTKLKFKI